MASNLIFGRSTEKELNMLDAEISRVLEKIRTGALNVTDPLADFVNKNRRLKILDALKKQLQSGNEHISIQGFFKLTKTEKRYAEYDTSLEWVDWPQHYPVHLLAGNGPFTSGKNIFAFFPEALGLLARQTQDVIGLEFIDVWTNIFNSVVFPCVKEVFDLPTQFKVYQSLIINLDQTIYLAAVFHEMGHRCGPWKVSPRPLVEMSISPYEAIMVNKDGKLSIAHERLMAAYRQITLEIDEVGSFVRLLPPGAPQDEFIKNG